MNAAAIPLDDWQLLYHEAMASILHVQTTIRRQALWAGIAYDLWSLSRSMRPLVAMQEHIYNSMLDIDGHVPEAIIEQVIASLTELVQSIEGLVDIANRYKLTNRSLTAGSVESIRQGGEELAHYLDILCLSIDPKVEEETRQGREDFAKGHGIPLDSLR